MKIFIITLITFAQIISTSLIANESPTKKPNDVKLTVTIGGKIGIKSKGCTGIGISCLKLDIDLEAVRFGKAPEGSQIVQFEFLSENKMQMTFFSENSGDMEVESNQSLGNQLSKMLGYTDVVVLKGKYKTIKRSDGAYVVVVNTMRK